MMLFIWCGNELSIAAPAFLAALDFRGVRITEGSGSILGALFGWYTYILSAYAAK